MTEPTKQELCALETFQPNVAEHLRAQARAANDHREKHLRARSDWRDGQQAIAWCRGRIAHLEAELATQRTANASLAAAGSQLLGAMEERDGILRDYQIESDTCVRDIVERTTNAACRFRDALTEIRRQHEALRSAAPRCFGCTEPATYSWWAGEEYACDRHVSEARRMPEFELPYAAILRSLSGGK